MRLDKALTHAGHGSRREMHAAIRAGRVTVDGLSAVGPDRAVEPDVHAILLDGVDIDWQPFYDLILNKPAGVVSSTDDPRDKTVLDLLPARYRRMELFPVGRLDKDATGLILLTNDGQTAHRLLSPKHHVPKKYLVTVDKDLDDSAADNFSKGIILMDGSVCKPAKLVIYSKNIALITLFEGKFHQIKRMMAICGYAVEAIHRLSIGGITLPEILEPSDFQRIERKAYPDIFCKQYAQNDS